MRRLYLALAIGALALPAYAQQMPQKDKPPPEQQQKVIASPSPNHILGSDLRGTNVYSDKDENVGEINEIVLDRNGKVVALVVGVGGFLGIGEKNVAIPFEAIEIQSGAQGGGGTPGQGQQTDTTEPNRIILKGMNRQDLEAAPSFSPQ